ncbi:tRNA (adenosine(37)-N6)-threonylcarbamoyltransferase complex dimerization subunit type 1 TsaB [Synergistales bacterium]|nr:tRNA (adenosine(37)-N6)-threonylcarbamoyltransferase complex dimerization subunit type 1 TsaB [Synergistales bacterium]
MNEVKTFLLSIDCSLRMTNAALLAFTSSGYDVLSSERLDIGRAQAEELPLLCARILCKAGLTFADLSLLSVTSGPGYFTGLRIGAAYAAALAYALGIKIIPVPTLEMLAYPYMKDMYRPLALAYAGRGRVYAASFCMGDDLPPGDYDKTSLEAWLEKPRDNLVVISDDPQKVMDTLEKTAFPCAIQPSPPDAVNAGIVAIHRRAEALSPMNLRLSYLREPRTI